MSYGLLRSHRHGNVLPAMFVLIGSRKYNLCPSPTGETIAGNAIDRALRKLAGNNLSDENLQVDAALAELAGEDMENANLQAVLAGSASESDQNFVGEYQGCLIMADGDLLVRAAIEGLKSRLANPLSKEEPLRLR